MDNVLNILEKKFTSSGLDLPKQTIVNINQLQENALIEMEAEALSDIDLESSRKKSLILISNILDSDGYKFGNSTKFSDQITDKAIDCQSYSFLYSFLLDTFNKEIQGLTNSFNFETYLEPKLLKSHVNLSYNKDKIWETTGSGSDKSIDKQNIINLGYKINRKKSWKEKFHFPDSFIIDELDHLRKYSKLLSWVDNLVLSEYIYPSPSFYLRKSLRALDEMVNEKSGEEYLEKRIEILLQLNKYNQDDIELGISLSQTVLEYLQKYQTSEAKSIELLEMSSENLSNKINGLDNESQYYELTNFILGYSNLLIFSLSNKDTLKEKASNYFQQIINNPNKTDEFAKQAEANINLINNL